MFNIGLSRNTSLIVVCSGDPVFDDFVTLIETIAAVARREHWKTVLVDCTSVAPTFTPEQRMQLGGLAGRMFAGFRVALVVPHPERFDATQKTAAAQGGQMRYFHDMEDAERWLAPG